MRYNFPRKRERAKRPSFSGFQLVFPPFCKVQPETPPTFFSHSRQDLQISTFDKLHRRLRKVDGNI
jgi:hypothetical protein